MEVQGLPNTDIADHDPQVVSTEIPFAETTCSRPDESENQLIVEELLKDYLQPIERPIQDRLLTDDRISVMNIGAYDFISDNHGKLDTTNDKSKFIFQRAPQRGQDPIIEEVSWSQASQAGSDLNNQKQSKISSIKPRYFSQCGSVTNQSSYVGSQDIHYQKSNICLDHIQVNLLRSPNEKSEYSHPSNLGLQGDFRKNDNTSIAYNSAGMKRVNPQATSYMSNQESLQVHYNSRIVGYLQTRPQPAQDPAVKMHKYYNYLESLLGTLPSCQPLMTRATTHAGSSITAAVRTNSKVSIRKVKKAVERLQGYSAGKKDQGLIGDHQDENFFYEELDKDYETPVECLNLDTAKTEHHDDNQEQSEDYGGQESIRRQKCRRTQGRAVNLTKIKRYVDELNGVKLSNSKSNKKLSEYKRRGIRPDDWRDQRFQSAFRSTSKKNELISTAKSGSKEGITISKTPQKRPPPSSSVVSSSAKKQRLIPGDLSPSSLNKLLRQEKQKKLQEQDRRVKELEELDRKRMQEELEKEKQKKDEERKQRVINLSKKKAEEEEKIKKLKLLQKMDIEEAKRTRKEQQKQLLEKNEKERQLRRMSKGNLSNLGDLEKLQKSSNPENQLESDSQRHRLTKSINLSIVPIAETVNSENQGHTKELSEASHQSKVELLIEHGILEEPQLHNRGGGTDEGSGLRAEQQVVQVSDKETSENCPDPILQDLPFQITPLPVRDLSILSPMQEVCPITQGCGSGVDPAPFIREKLDIPYLSGLKAGADSVQDRLANQKILQVGGVLVDARKISEALNGLTKSDIHLEFGSQEVKLVSLKLDNFCILDEEIDQLTIEDSNPHNPDKYSAIQAEKSPPGEAILPEESKIVQTVETENSVSIDEKVKEYS